MNIADVQNLVDQTWTLRTYGQDFLDDPRPHRDFVHALLHVQKAAGKLAAMTDDADHGIGALDENHAIGKLLADLVICAARMANTIRNDADAPLAIDLELAVQERLNEIEQREKSEETSKTDPTSEHS